MAKIATVHFAPMITRRNYRAKPYEIPAIKMGDKPFILDIGVERQVERGGYSTSASTKERSIHRYIVEDTAIARDLVNEWAHNGLGMTEGQRPGVWVVRETIPILNRDTGVQDADADGKGLTRPATKEEFAKMWDEDVAAYRGADIEYAKWCVSEGNRLGQDPRQIQFIPKKYKMAAEHLQMTTDWAKVGSGTLEMKACPFCAQLVPKVASVCFKCGQTIDAVAFAAKEQELRDQAARKRAG